MKLYYAKHKETGAVLCARGRYYAWSEIDFMPPVSIAVWPTEHAAKIWAADYAAIWGATQAVLTDIRDGLMEIREVTL